MAASASAALASSSILGGLAAAPATDDADLVADDGTVLGVLAVFVGLRNTNDSLSEYFIPKDSYSFLLSASALAAAGDENCARLGADGGSGDGSGGGVEEAKLALFA